MKHPIQSGELIRSKKTGQILIVMAIHATGWIVADLDDRNNPSKIMAILFRDQNNWCRDIEMDDCKLMEVTNQKL